ncbi:single stranded DNA-binding domain-containing protein [Stutzerimonas azotifigens]|uniref:hypothetical protein n=1 Tax=Stutzerimonas azotifigens TaxID=291995 RepID=UPI00041C2DD3|nr:hypothetical protein [Stutzerimonas azotifigens]
MLTSMITGRLVKAPQLNADGRYVATVAGLGDDRSVRVVCRRKAHANQLLELPQGSPVAVSGLLRISPVINDKGEPLALLTLEVTAILTPQPKGLLARLFT